MVEANPSVLNAGETDIVVSATVTDDTGVTFVIAFAYDPSTGNQIGTETELTLESGDNLNGVYTGTIVLTPEISDGPYQVAVFAANAESVEGDWGTYAVNGDTVIILERGNSEPGEPGEPGDTNDKKDQGCCKVSINISSGPVNIYVCGTENKVNAP